MDKLIAILNEIRPGVDWVSETSIIDDGLLDSFDIISLVGEFEAAFGAKVGLEHLEPENFNSVDAMKALVEELGGQL